MVSASDGSLCAMAEMLLAVVLLGRVVEEGSEALNPVLPDMWHRCWKLFSVVVASLLVFWLVMQVPVPGHAKRLMYRRLKALGIEAAKAMVGTLVISGRDMVFRVS